jgi:hypothetical protein
MTTLPDTIAAARLSWQCNYTIGDERWRLKQLHRLYQLLLNNRDELVALVCEGRRGKLLEYNPVSLTMFP